MLKFDPIFNDGAILQAGKTVRISGCGEGTVTVKLGNSVQAATVIGDKWYAEFPAQDYNTVCTLTASSDCESVTLTDITFGDVYLLAGQSNIQFKLCEAIPDGEIYECDDIRLFSTDRLENNEYFHPADGWVKCSKTTAPNFSAIGYFMARDLHKRDGKPIGLVSLYQGASIIQSWLSLEAIDELASDMPDGELHWDPHWPEYSLWNGDSTLYNFGFKQVLPFSFKAVIWYQGESNALEHESCFYDRMLTKMIELWRTDLKDPTLPFIIVQIADFDPRKSDAWSRIQEAQERVALSTPDCYFVKCADICETDNIHPPTKHILAKRIADIL